MLFVEITPDALNTIKNNREAMLFLSPSDSDCVIDETVAYLFVRRGKYRLVIGSILIGQTHQVAYRDSVSEEIVGGRSTVVLELYRLLAARNNVLVKNDEPGYDHDAFTQYLDRLDWQKYLAVCFVNDVRLFDAPKVLTDAVVTASTRPICFVSGEVF